MAGAGGDGYSAIDITWKTDEGVRKKVGIYCHVTPEMFGRPAVYTWYFIDNSWGYYTINNKR